MEITTRSPGDIKGRRCWVGIDAGSVAVKLGIVSADGHVLGDRYLRHEGRPLQAVARLLDELARHGLRSRQIVGLCATGSGGKEIARRLGIEFSNEVVCLTEANRTLYPEQRTVVEIGGEDSHLLMMEAGDDSKELHLSDFAMNSVCAAGTGVFLDQQASRLRIPVEQMGAAALESAHPSRIAGRCSVFANSDMIHLQQRGVPVPDILAGLCQAIARNFRGTVARRDALLPPVAFEGGVAANAGVVKAFTDLLGLKEDEVSVPRHFATLGAMGAALLARNTGSVARRFETLADVGPLLSRGDYTRDSLEPLGGDGSRSAPAGASASPAAGSSEPQAAYLGVDVGSISTNLAVLAEDGSLLAKRYLMTAGQPIEAVRQGLRELDDELGPAVEICGVGTTGSGRYMIGDVIGADVIRNEITAQTRAAVALDPEVDTILEIGGQDSKFISTRDGVIVDFEMNKVCAAGTGSFLEEQAERLGMTIDEEFGRLALTAKRPVRLGERCSVFMGSDVGHHQAHGAAPEDIAAGLCYSIVDNYLQRVARNKKIGERVLFQGGVAFNEGVRAAFEKVLGRPVVVPPNHEVSGAIGCALAARDERSGATRFKGFRQASQAVETTSFICEDCSNSCDVSRIVTGSGAALHYGSRCGKFDEASEKARGSETPDLFLERERLLLAHHRQQKGRLPAAAPTVGIPRCMVAFHELFPFWAAFFDALGYRVVLSEKSSKKTVETGNELCKSDFCFPIKVAHGHVQDLVHRGVDAIFLPAIIGMGRAPGMANTLACPYVEALPDVIVASLRLDRRGVDLLRPVMHYRRGEKHILKVLTAALRLLDPGLSKGDVRRAFGAGTASQQVFSQAITRRGEQVLEQLTPDRPAVVVVGRAYNTCDPEISLRIPRILRRREALAIPLDFLPLDQVDISRLWPSMYWYHGQRILKAAELVLERDDLQAVYVTNFGCGPDSFLLSYFARAMGDKPYLEVEVDEHSAGAGAVTRCEAFLDSLNGKWPHRRAEPSASRQVLQRCMERPQNGDRTFYLPQFSDHWRTVAAALRACGVKAEVLPRSSAESLRLGKRHTLGKECLAHTITTGDVMRKVHSEKFDAGRSAFLGVRMGGPCRVGQFLPAMELTVNDHTDVFVPFYKQPASFQRPAPVFEHVDRPRFERLGGYGVFGVDLLLKAALQTRPYEMTSGETDRIYGRFLDEICAATEDGGDVIAVLADARRAYEAVAVDRSKKKPVVGLLGQAFYIYNRAVNGDLIAKLEALGLEVRTPYGAEMGLYQYFSMKSIYRLKKQRLKQAGAWVFDRMIQHRMARIMRPFKGFLRDLEEPSVEELVELNRPYLDPALITETTLSVGKAFHHHRQGAHGVILLGSFCCMPGAISDSIMSGRLREDLGGFPYLRLAYDAQEQTNVDTRIEAFAYQAEQYKNSRSS